jgi:hypothetical protein
VQIEEEVTIEELDEAMQHIQTLLADPRLIPRRKLILLSSLDDLLDARLEMVEKANKIASGGNNGN